MNRLKKTSVAVIMLSGLTFASTGFSTEPIQYPFPHKTPYTAGTIKPTGTGNSETQMNDSVIKNWNQWKAAYLLPAGEGEYFVKYNDDKAKKEEPGITVSEAHGYGMLLTAYMAGYDPEAKTYFDGLYKYYKAHQSKITPLLMAWKQNELFEDIEGVDSATDGDLDIAYALLLADNQWGSNGPINYRQDAKDMINAIMQGDVNREPSFWTLKMGDAQKSTSAKGKATRPSDFMLDHLRVFENVTGDSRWHDVRVKTYSIIDTMYNGFSHTTGLLPDFVIYKNNSYQPAGPGFEEEDTDGDYSYNSCRTPWRITTDYLLNGDPSAMPQLTTLNNWVQGPTATDGHPSEIKPGYTLEGVSLGENYHSAAFFAPFGVSAMISAQNQTWLNAIWTYTRKSASEGYYEDSIKLLSMLVMSGNWWQPN